MVQVPSPLDLRIITHNIRYATSHPFEGEETWDVRCPRLNAELVFHTRNRDAAFICLQEVLFRQLQDVRHALNHGGASTWESIGVGRDDGHQAGEFSPIFYKPKVWKLDESRTIWLSEHPHRPSKGWDAASIRIVTLGVFTHRETLRRLLVMNTHLDDQGATSRAESARMLLKLVKQYQEALGSEVPIILAGDFNSPPDDEAYRIMTSKDSSMSDIRGLQSETEHYGHQMTFTSFGEAGATPTRIDFIFCNKQYSYAGVSYAVLENVFDDGIYISDHRAVVADVKIYSARKNLGETISTLNTP